MQTMTDRKAPPNFPVDESGEIFQADLTDEREPSPASREPSAHDLNTDGEETDSQAGDEFMKQHYKRQ
jgi:hypothetical protein